MRIVIDCQPLQGDNAHRGIGRYTEELTRAIIAQRGDREVFVMLNGLFTQSVEHLRATFSAILPAENIKVFHPPAAIVGNTATAAWNRRAAEALREAFIARLQPDVVLVGSLFESWNHSDRVVTSIGAYDRHIPVAVVLHDLIPLIYGDVFLKKGPVRDWYDEKLHWLSNADHLLANSECTRRDAISYLGWASDAISNILGASIGNFRPIDIAPDEEAALRQRLGLARPFIMYTGGINYRKNIEGLIAAFADLPLAVRNEHQLAIVCSIDAQARASLSALVSAHGMTPADVVFTGYVSDTELQDLYNLCKAFIFPSLYEGFGLPILEALHCGKAVIASNNSSLPEVVGREDALFDVEEPASMTKAIERVLTDEVYRRSLEATARPQAELFTWQEVARRSLDVLDGLAAKPAIRRVAASHRFGANLAYVSPMPPARSGISYYSDELIRELKKFYNIDIILSNENIQQYADIDGVEFRSIKYFEDNCNLYDRIIYHFGNSTFHCYMFDLLCRIPGVVVLHDFFLSGVVGIMDSEVSPGILCNQLYKQGGYLAVQQRFGGELAWNVINSYPCNADIVDNALGVIVHSACARHLGARWFGTSVSDEWHIIPHLRSAVHHIDRSGARAELGIPADAFVVCSFGILGPIKQNHRLIEAWIDSALAEDQSALLIFVGENNAEGYGQALIDRIAATLGASRIRITGWSSEQDYHRYLAAADIAVQIRTQSRGETSGTILDCMNYGLATIVNAHGAMADLDERAIWKIPDVFCTRELSDALETLRRDPERRKALGNAARQKIRLEHAPSACVRQYVEAIETSYRNKPAADALLEWVAENGLLSNAADLVGFARAIAHTFPPLRRNRQILVDISELVQRDVKTGIQRVVRSVIAEWLHNPPEGYRIEPVYATTSEQGYRYARRFTVGFIGCPESKLMDEPIDFQAGDIFFGIDLQQSVVTSKRSVYAEMRASGVKVYFLVYDLLPVLLPHAFDSGTAKLHGAWLSVVAENNGAVCDSRTVADELRRWIEQHHPERAGKCRISWSHNGADIANSVPTKGLPPEAAAVLAKISRLPSFLMVGTIEPRKQHQQALAAFEQLWRSDKAVQLVIVGKIGWHQEEFVRRLREHPELGRRLFLFESISDEYLEAIYGCSACLIASSEGEGFGLPLIEAAMHRLPIIARDIPVFREVAGTHAFYFNGLTADSLACAIEAWLALDTDDESRRAEAIPWLTWKQSAAQLMRCILDGENDVTVV